MLLSLGRINPFLSIASYSFGLDRVLTVFFSVAFVKIIYKLIWFAQFKCWEFEFKFWIILINLKKCAQIKMMKIRIPQIKSHLIREIPSRIPRSLIKVKMQFPYLNPRSAHLFNSKFNRESLKPPNNKNPFWICWSKNMTNRCKGTIRKTNKRNWIIRDGKGIPNKGFLNSCQEIRNSTN